MRVLFICVANSGRSVMAERMFNERTQGRHVAESAGSDPGTAVHPVVLDALSEIGLDASDYTPRRLTNDLVARADVVVSTCGEEACPVTPPGTRRVYWNLPDPKNQPLHRVRAIRDDIGALIESLVAELDAVQAEPSAFVSSAAAPSRAPRSPSGRRAT
jgi:protein-tyrosine-phosphatase